MLLDLAFEPASERDVQVAKGSERDLSGGGRVGSWVTSLHQSAQQTGRVPVREPYGYGLDAGRTARPALARTGPGGGQFEAPGLLSVQNVALGLRSDGDPAKHVPAECRGIQQPGPRVPLPPPDPRSRIRAAIVRMGQIVHRHGTPIAGGFHEFVTPILERRVACDERPRQQAHPSPGQLRHALERLLERDPACRARSAGLGISPGLQQYLRSRRSRLGQTLTRNPGDERDQNNVEAPRHHNIRFFPHNLHRIDGRNVTKVWRTCVISPIQ